MTKRSMQLHRRAVLRGAGVALGLPWLEAMAPTARAATAAGPKRMAFIYLPNGMNTGDLMPAIEGANYDITPTLEPIKSFRDQVMVLSGLAHKKGVGGGHSMASSAYLTGVAARPKTAINIFVGESVDQLAARRIGDRTRLSSLQLGCDKGKQAGICDSGDACAYLFNISWKTPTLPLPPEVDPREAFERLFGSAGDPGGRFEAVRRRQNKSVLDFAAASLRRLNGNLGVADRSKLDEYSTAVREVERQIEQAEKFPRPGTAYHRPTGIPADYPQHLRLMYDLMALAFQTDSTRIVTFLAAHEESHRSYPFIGIPDAHHDLSHHKDDPAVMAKISIVNRFHVDQFGYFLKRLQAVKEGDRTLLDNSMVLFGGGIANGNQHNGWDLPILLAGRGGGTIDSGRHVRYPKFTSMCELFLAMLDRMDIPEPAFAGITKRLPGLKIGDTLAARDADFDKNRTLGWKASRAA